MHCKEKKTNCYIEKLNFFPEKYSFKEKELIITKKFVFSQKTSVS